MRELNQRILSLCFRDHADWKVLDVGAGSGELGKIGCDDVSVWIDLDLSFDMLQIDSSRRRCRVLGDGAALPFVSGSFDAVIIKFALHHMRDAEHLFCELARVLKPGGICVIIDPFFSGSAIDRVRLAVLIGRAVVSHGVAEIFCTYRTLQSVKRMIRKSGLAVEQEYNRFSPEGPTWLPTVLLELRHTSC